LKTAEIKKTLLFKKKTGNKILFWIVFLTTVFLIFLIISGYFSALKHPTYLPEYYSGKSESYPGGGNLVVLKNPWYMLQADESGRVIVKTLAGEIIMSDLIYYSAYNGAKENWGLKNISVKLSSDSTITVKGEGPLNVEINLLLTVKSNSPKLDIKVKTFYNSNTIVQRESLVAKFDVPVSEVYLKNRKADVKHFESEYWLQREGVRFGNGSRSSLIYHTPNISSLQLNTKKNQLYVNLDFCLDHPYIQIPYQKDGGGKWIDLSAEEYSAGSERNNEFSISFGTLPKVTPRLMLVPQGYLAGFIFTEHADSGNIKSHRAAYFGAENITNINEAVGGFAGHKIPVTKSVFYSDTTIGRPSGSSIRDDLDKPQFLDFLDQLNATGLYDICLHTPEGYSTNRETLAEAIKFMKDRFNTCTWIDHGMYPGQINRESFVCDGLNPSSEFYAADLWEEYDTRYFWNTADELMRTSETSIKKEIRKLRFINVSMELWRRYLYHRKYNGMSMAGAFFELLKGNLPRYESNSLQPFKGSSYPTPLYWQNHTRTRDFYSWTTNYTEDYSSFSTDRAEDQLNKTLIQLNLLLSDWGVFINHAYFARNRKGYDTLCESDGKIVINPFFDKILKFMADKKDKGDLYITTVRDLLDYWIQLEGIYFEYMPSGVIRIYNNNDESIKGLSLVLGSKANSIRINEEIPKSRQVEGNTIIWFNMAAKGFVNLQVEP
jgi:hypothetical protein